MAYFRSEDLEKLKQAIVDGQMDQLIAETEERPKVDKKLQELVLKSVDAAIETLLSPEAIGRGAGLLGGDRFLAMSVIASAIGDKVTQGDCQRTCERCGRSDVLLMIATRPRREQLVCPACGLVN